MKYVAIATANPIKIKAIKQGFRRLLKEDVKISFMDTPSNVSKQPFNDDVFKGAENRLRNCIKMQSSNYLFKPDFFVSCEGGIIKLHELYFNVQIVVVQDKLGQISYGISQGLEISDEHVNEMTTTGLTISKLWDKIFNGKGGVRTITKGIFKRENLIEDATIMALSNLLINRIAKKER